MRILVTGANGFVGRYLTKDLSENGHNVIGLDLNFSKSPDYCSEQITADLTDADRIEEIFRRIQPNACVHLGGMAYVPDADAQPLKVFAVNTLGTLHVLNAVRKHAPECRLLAVSTAQVYGAKEADTPLLEEAPLRPCSPYAISKAAADLAVLAHAQQYDLKAMTARPSNHTGPCQSPFFVVPAFAKQIREIAGGKAPSVIRVGNLESRRDILDVRDVVRAYRLLLEKGTVGSAYNIASNRMVRIGDILAEMCRLAGINPRIETDMSLYRPADSSPVLSTKRIEKETGWKPQIPLHQTLLDVLKDCSL